MIIIILFKTYMYLKRFFKKDAPLTRDDLTHYLEKENIETRPMLPLLNQPIYKKIFGNIERDYPVAKWIDHNGFYVGCHHGLNEDDLEIIVVAIKSFMDVF